MVRISAYTPVWLLLSVGVGLINTPHVVMAQAGTEQTASPRIVSAPTAWVAPIGTVSTTAGTSGNADGVAGIASVVAGLGAGAHVALDVSDRVAVCRLCGTVERVAASAWIPSAEFKVGLPEDTFFGGQPGLALGFRRSLLTRTLTIGGEDLDVDLAELYLAATATWGPLRLHAGANLWDAAVDDGRQVWKATDRNVVSWIRPLGGIEWTPWLYPATQILADIVWVPELGDGPEPRLGWLLDVGVRYTVPDWGAVVLAVRNRERDQLDGSTILLRFSRNW